MVFCTLYTPLKRQAKAIKELKKIYNAHFTAITKIVVAIWTIFRAHKSEIL